jgi:Domain of unknown function (DUF222)
MDSIAFKQASAAWDALAAGEATELLTSAQRQDQLERITTLERILPALKHDLINELAASATVAELGGSLPRALANRLRIRRREAVRLIEAAADLGERRTLTGEPLAPKLEATAAGQAAGLISGEQVGIIRGFLHQLPCFVEEPARVKAERDLAEVASRYRPDQLERFAERYELVLNPDGHYTDADRARRRGITVGPQGPDGMSRLSGYLDPELRAGWDAIAAKWAAPGMCNPADQKPTVSGTPSQEAIDADARSAAQRNHDALNTMVRSILTSGELGKHQGVPVTITVTAKLKDLQAKAGMARTGGGTVLPITDVIRMSANAYHYLLLFDKAKRIELFKGRTTRCATKEQRLVLYALERGCTHPDCTAPPYWCEVHHANKDWAAGGQTNIDELTLACGPDNRLVDDKGWRTRKRTDGTTEWIPPPGLDRGQPRTNTYFHPERMLGNDDDESD